MFLSLQQRGLWALVFWGCWASVVGVEAEPTMIPQRDDGFLFIVLCVAFYGGVGLLSLVLQ